MTMIATQRGSLLALRTDEPGRTGQRRAGA